MVNCVFCNDTGTIMDAAAYDWGMRAAYGLPQKQSFKPLRMEIPCPFCHSTTATENNNPICQGKGTNVCWPLIHRMEKQGRLPPL